MKRDHHEILEYIYKNDEAGIRELSALMKRKHNDHRDFYALSALLKEGYIEFTGPNCKEALVQAQTFQCYSQGTGQQAYKNTNLFSNEEDSYFFIGAKGIAYFHQRSELRKGWLIVAALSVLVSIMSGVIVAQLTSTAPEPAITSHCS